jgi:predicted extracellular nuclease
MKKTTTSKAIVAATLMLSGWLSAVPLTAQITKCSELFISEYIDGPGKNKIVEIYNPTEEDIDLSVYAIHV